jgi:hypothetical protein
MDMDSVFERNVIGREFREKRGFVSRAQNSARGGPKWMNVLS